MKNIIAADIQMVLMIKKVKLIFGVISGCGVRYGSKTARPRMVVMYMENKVNATLRLFIKIDDMTHDKPTKTNPAELPKPPKINIKTKVLMIRIAKKIA